MTMHPQSKNKANISGMAVTATLVFSDEAHREAWLRRMEVIADERDFARRRDSQNLVYIVGEIGPGDFDQEKNATGTTCEYGAHRGGPCGAAQYKVQDRVKCRDYHDEHAEPCSVVVEGVVCGARRYRMISDPMRTICARGHRQQLVHEDLPD